MLDVPNEINSVSKDVPATPVTIEPEKMPTPEIKK
jgi:hypothetical protein